jgi:hypothetical protein
MILIIIIEFIVIKAISFKIISLVLFLASIITGLYAFIINPGVTFKEKNNNNNNQQEKNFLCPSCNFTYPKNGKTYQHCFACQVCVPDNDHHCGIFGKCIGYKNKISFYLFPTFSIILLILCFVSVFYHFVNEVGKNKDNNDKLI